MIDQTPLSIIILVSKIEVKKGILLKDNYLIELAVVDAGVNVSVKKSKESSAGRIEFLEIRKGFMKST